jgi:hypothetical protein
MLSLIERVNEVNTAPLLTGLNPLEVDKKVVGYVNVQLVPLLLKHDNVFKVKDKDPNTLVLSKPLENASQSIRTEAISAVTKELRDLGIIKGWRDELLPVVSSFSDEPVFLLERAAYPFFGIKGYGVHVNGFVVYGEGEKIKMWVGKRSKTKSTWPSMLDHIVAGGHMDFHRLQTS